MSKYSGRYNLLYHENYLICGKDIFYSNYSALDTVESSPPSRGGDQGVVQTPSVTTCHPPMGRDSYTKKSMG